MMFPTLLPTVWIWGPLLVLFGSSATGDEALQVVYAGFGRSGTHSLAIALKRLGYAPCHGRDICMNLEGSHHALAQAFVDHHVPAIIRETEQLGYNATLEIHGTYWREIMSLRPNAKYIFVLREFEPWLASTLLVYRAMAPLFRYPLRIVPYYNSMAEFFAALWSHNLQVSREEGWEHAWNPQSETQIGKLKTTYYRHVADAKAVLSQGKHNTLLFRLDQGYAALCEFLEIPLADCPSDPFPHAYKAREVLVSWFLFRIQVILMIALPLLLTWLTFTVLSRVWRWITKRKRKLKLG